MSFISARSISESLQSYASADRAKNLSRFFKTGKGQYGEGDKFLGIVVPDIRRVAKEYYKQVTLETIRQLVKSPYHEVRLCGLIMLVHKYNELSKTSLRGGTTKQSHNKNKLIERQTIYEFYLKNTKYINNWDLVDLTAPNIVGDFLLNRNKYEPPLRFPSLVKAGRQGRSSPVFLSPFAIHHLPDLIKLAKSASVWERRIAILSTFSFIRAGRHQEAFAIGELLLNDKHDLIHKAVGWMLREVGKRIGKDVLRDFLNKHAATMPRTTLRYAIEHLSERERKQYMNFN